MHQHHNHQPDKSKVLHRLKIIQGHLKAIEQMITEDKYCVDIVHQSMAVQKALKKVDMEIIKDHLNTCVIDQIKNGEEDKTIIELLNLYQLKQLD